MNPSRSNGLRVVALLLLAPVAALAQPQTSIPALETEALGLEAGPTIDPVEQAPEGLSAEAWRVTVDPTIVNEDAKLLASDGAAGDRLGWSVGVSDSTVVVGTFPGESAYVFEEPVVGWSGTLSESARLLASDSAPNDGFGRSVAISGSTVVVGAYRADGSVLDSGSAYVFEEPVGGWSGTLSESAKLLASDGSNDDHFGLSVAVSGSTIVVGAWMHDDHSGSAYVFEEPVGGWSGTLNESAKLLASDGAIGDQLGLSVAISGSTVVAGALSDDGPGTDSGSVYVFEEPVGGWSGTLNENAKLLASDGAAGDLFGLSVAISGSTVAAGASWDDDNGTESGSVYVFEEPVSGWSGTLQENAKLLASDGEQNDWFGRSVAVSGSSVAAGAEYDDDNGGESGSAYVFEEPVGGWSGILNESAKLLAGDGAQYDEFGCSVAISGSTVVAGARRDSDNGFDSGSAYVFVVAGSVIFADGFESGNLSAWSATSP